MSYLKFTFVVCIYLFVNCSALENSDFVLQKYSYTVKGLVGNNALRGGTGCFIKYKSKYFFISAWHCFSFKNHISRQFEDSQAVNIDNLVIYRNVKDITTDSYFRMTLTDELKQKPFYFEKTVNGTLLDISAFEVERQSPFLFDYIDFENADTSGLFVEAEVVYFGFPVLNGRQVDSSQRFEGYVTEVDPSRKEYTIAIEGYIGCSGAPLFTMVDDTVQLKAVLFYALKDNTGKAALCQAVDIKWLRDMLDDNL